MLEHIPAQTPKTTQIRGGHVQNLQHAWSPPWSSSTLPRLQVHREGKMCSSTPWSKGRAHRAQKENSFPPAILPYLIGCTIPIQGHADFIFTEVFTGQSNPSSKRNLPQSTGQNIFEQHLKELKIGSL